MTYIGSVVSEKKKKIDSCLGRKVAQTGQEEDPVPSPIFTLIGEDRLTSFMVIYQHYVLMKQT